MIHCLDEQCWKQDKCLLGCQLEIPALRPRSTPRRRKAMSERADEILAGIDKGHTPSDASLHSLAATYRALVRIAESVEVDAARLREALERIVKIQSGFTEQADIARAALTAPTKEGT